ncbi:hypothetical protein [uncultured Legionella sp.]|uniref:hypothetical protein n=1 Tax=uncultured Legionella sp. TaxID=210934 RepID=UPI0026364000|nr:hypothetical protein [uncultured Legionella sp.]
MPPNSISIPCKEPGLAKYIHINPDKNLVHLLIPIIGGQEISTDNTCKSTKVLRDFFDGGGALRELTKYKAALESDIQLLVEEAPQKVAKAERLEQINTYIEGVKSLRWSYAASIMELMKKPSNLYSIQLRPSEQDPESKVINPLFTINRKNSNDGTPLSALYLAAQRIFPSSTIALNLQANLMKRVLGNLPDNPTFNDIQVVLKEECSRLCDVTIDFTTGPHGVKVNETYINNQMGFSSGTPPEEYIEALFGYCAPHLWDNTPVALFYSIGRQTDAEKTEKLSILTQFFLAYVNIYCKSNNISHQNFGSVFDGSAGLSNEFVTLISNGLSKGDDIEECICSYLNTHVERLGMSRFLNEQDIAAIKSQFTIIYKTVTATKENPHMDDFLIMDPVKTGPFVTHQGSICVDFSKVVEPALDNALFKNVREDCMMQPRVIPHKNEFINENIEVDLELWLSSLNDEEFEHMSSNTQKNAAQSMTYQIRLFLQHVARGKQIEAEQLLTSDNAQLLLRTPGKFTDYSGRTFNCTAYEYAYWAKDSHMCHMLETYMKLDTKEIVSERMMSQPDGLSYSQNNTVCQSAHFDFTPLKTALQQYSEGVKSWRSTKNTTAMKAAWMNVGLAQRNVPAHIAQEYCNPKGLVAPLLGEDSLPRELHFFNFNIKENDFWFKSSAPNNGLGFGLAFTRGEGTKILVGNARGTSFEWAIDDLNAINHLEQVRTSELALLLPENLALKDTSVPGLY